MLPLLALLCLPSANPFHEADSSSWLVKIQFETSGRTSIPGADDFHDVSSGGRYAATDAGGSSLGKSLRLILNAPRKGAISWFGGVAFGEHLSTWDVEVTFREGGGYTAEMNLEKRFVELSGGVEVRLARKHFLSAEAVLPLQLGDGELTKTVAGEEVFSGEAPSSFELSKVPRLGVVYDYRLFHRINLGIGWTFFDGRTFAGTPEFTEEPGKPTRLDSGEDGSVFSTHLGWTFGGW